MAYPVSLLVYAPQAGPFELVLSKQDTNDYDGADELRIEGFGPDGQWLLADSIPDDGNTQDDHQAGPEQRKAIRSPAVRRGVYEVRCEGTPDTWLGVVGCSWPHLAVKGREVYWRTSPPTLYVMQPPGKSLGLSLEAFHGLPAKVTVSGEQDQVLGALAVGGEGAPKVAAQEFAGRRREGVLRLDFAGEDFILRMEGVEPMACLDRESADVLPRALAQQRRKQFAAMMSDTFGPATRDAEPLDFVDCGEADSERRHGWQGPNSGEFGSETGTGPEGQTWRRCTVGRHPLVAFSYRMKVDPQRPTYLTTCTWGSEVGGKASSTVGRHPFVANFEPETVKRGHRLLAADRLLEEENEAVPLPVSPGRWLYVTRLLPEDLTAGQQSITVRVESLPESDTRAFYGMWTHTVPNLIPARSAQFQPRSGSFQGQALHSSRRLARSAQFQPRSGSFQGQALHSSRRLPLRRALTALVRRMDGIIDDLKTCQWYGAEWEKLEQKQPELAKVRGAIYERPWRPPESDRVDLGCLERSAQWTMRMLMSLEAFAWGYATPLSRHHQDEELFRRVVAGLDFLTRAQSASGGFEDETGSQGWLGGPDRKPGGGCLEGFLTAACGNAFLRLFPVLKGGPMLSERIDSDGDGQADAPRGEAYAQMFQRWVDRVLLNPGEGRGHAPNQDTADLWGVAVLNRCHRLLTGRDALSPEALKTYEEEVFGGRPPYHLAGGDWTRRFNWKHWFTPKGLLMEGRTTDCGAGYEAGYGQATLFNLAEYIHLSGEEGLVPFVGKYLDAYQHFLDPARLDRGICLSNGLEWMTARRTRAARGANIHAGTYVHAALLGSEPARRILQILLQRFEDENLTDWDDCFYSVHRQSVNSLLPFVELLQQWQDRGVETLDFKGPLPAEIRTDYRLPMERASFGWADEVARCAVAKEGDRRLYVAFDWDSQSAVRKAKFHYYDGERDLVGVVPEAWDDDLYGGRFQDFLVLMNSSERSRTVDLSAWKGYPLKDLLHQRPWKKSRLVLPPGTSAILALLRGPQPARSAAFEPHRWLHRPGGRFPLPGNAGGDGRVHRRGGPRGRGRHRLSGDGPRAPDRPYRDGRAGGPGGC